MKKVMVMKEIRRVTLGHEQRKRKGGFKDKSKTLFFDFFFFCSKHQKAGRLFGGPKIKFL